MLRQTDAWSTEREGAFLTQPFTHSGLIPEILDAIKEEYIWEGNLMGFIV